MVVFESLRGPVFKSEDSETLRLSPLWFEPRSSRCEMPNATPVGQVVFLRHSGFRPPLINDRLDISEILLKGRKTLIFCCIFTTIEFFVITGHRFKVP